MSGNNRLHRLLQNDRWEEAVDWLSTAEGSALAGEMDADGNLPIHMALQRAKLHHSANTLIRLLVGKLPGCLRHRNMQGSLPIHFAAAAAGFEAIKYVGERYPEGLAETNRAGDLPIHIAARAMTCAKTVRWVAERYPEGLGRQDAKGNLPIHVILSQKYWAVVKVAEELTKLFAEMHPPCVKHRNADGDLPIHMALRHKAESMVRYLYEKYPDCVKVKGRTGCLPLHLATWGHSDFARLFFERYPDGLRIENDNGVLPLHTAAFNNNEIAIEFADAYPDGLRHKDKVGNLPIHEAARSAKSHYMIKELAERYPEGLDEVNDDGFTPVIATCEDKLPKYRLDVVKIMMTVRSEAMKKKEEDGEDKGPTPEEIAADLRRQLHEAKSCLDSVTEERARLRADLDRAAEATAEDRRQMELLRTSLSALAAGTTAAAAPAPSPVKMEAGEEVPDSAADGGGADADADADADAASASASAEDENGEEAAPTTTGRGADKLRDALATVVRERERVQRDLDALRSASAESKESDRRRIDELESSLRSATDEKDRMWKELDITKQVASETVVSYQRAIQGLRTSLTAAAGEVGTLRVEAVGGRTSERHLLESLLRGGHGGAAAAAAIPGLDALSEIAKSLKERLDAVSDRVDPTGRPSLTRAMFPSFIKDPHIHQASLLQVIDALTRELTVVEGRYFPTLEAGARGAEEAVRAANALPGGGVAAAAAGGGTGTGTGTAAAATATAAGGEGSGPGSGGASSAASSSPLPPGSRGAPSMAPSSLSSSSPRPPGSRGASPRPPGGGGGPAAAAAAAAAAGVAKRTRSAMMAVVDPVTSGGAPSPVTPSPVEKRPRPS